MECRFRKAEGQLPRSIEGPIYSQPRVCEKGSITHKGTCLGGKLYGVKLSDGKGACSLLPMDVCFQNVFLAVQQPNHGD